MKEVITKTIKVKYIKDSCGKTIKPIDSFGDWIDLRCSEDIELDCGDYYEVPLGIAVEMPDGYEAHIVPRSSTYKKWGIIQANSVGIVDNKYCGDGDEWHFPVIALRKTKLHKNDRICQFRLFRSMEQIDCVFVETLGNENRGGLGSTGTI